MNESILIIGESNFIGSHLIHQFDDSDRIAIIDDVDMINIHHSIIFEKHNISVDLINDIMTRFLFNKVINFKKTDDNTLFNCCTANGARFIQVTYDDSITYGDIIIRFSKCFGPKQSAEKFIPKMICQALNEDFLTVYGDGQVSYDWLYVSDCCNAIYKIACLGMNDIYDVSSNFQIKNIDIARMILKFLNLPMTLVDYIGECEDNELKFDNTKVLKLGWKPRVEFEEGLRKTINFWRSI